MELGFPVHHYLGNTSRFEIQGFWDTLTSEEWQETKGAMWCHTWVRKIAEELTR